jgi:hypothetical protein
MSALLSMQASSQAGCSVWPRFDMKKIRLFALCTVLALGGGGPSAVAAENDGVALAIIYDTSGSMKEPVPDEAGKTSPKYVIANRALLAVTKQIQAFATNTASGTPRKVEAGLFVFQGQGARDAVKFGPFDPAAFRDFAESFSKPNGNTPLGNALRKASESVFNSPLTRKHVLVITDGMNTAGPAPEAVLPGLKKQAQEKGTSLAVHFVAFDVDSKFFAAVKKQGALVVSAANEKQLNTQLDFILKKQILLEDEEPAGGKAK